MMTTRDEAQVQHALDWERSNLHEIRGRVRRVQPDGGLSYNDTNLYVLGKPGSTTVMLKSQALNETDGTPYNVKSGPNRYHAIHLHNRDEIERLRDLLCTITGAAAIQIHNA